VKSTRAIRIITSLSLGVVILATATWVGLGQISGQISRISVFGDLENRPEKVSSALNYLVVGSDNREGLTKEQIRELRVGGTDVAAGGRSDTMLLVHISKARDSAFIVSLPRDTLVTIPAHISQDGKSQIPDRPGKLNAAFAFGGAPLLIQTIELMTSLKIDHYIEVSFAGFVGVVDALGGIKVCSKVDIDDPKSHLVMKAGYHLLDGVESLKYVRTRDFDGRGDIGRMERQQQFVSAIVRKATSSGTLLNPIKLANFYQATIATVKMDEGVTKNDLLTLGKQMSNLSSGSVRTLTVPLSNPNGRHPTVGSVVIWDDVLAPELWNRIKNDEALVDTVIPTADPSAKASAGVSSKATPGASPTPTIIDKFKTQTAANNPCASKK
jgi:LCP family protein required for cell wall assembly